MVYAKAVSCVGVKDYGCDRCIFYDCYKDRCLLLRSNSCMDLQVRTGCHRGGAGGALG